ncbi:MAG: hypothetical protein LBU40_01675 [Methanobrevibacter sp.]|jgi:hypothetical protein|nr:hypothetical protein [Methanobrevibacter sp.]
MEYTTISAKLPRDEITLFKNYCEKEDISPSAMIRKLIKKEIDNPISDYIAGKNIIKYNKRNDKFQWSIELDNAERFNILDEIKIDFLNDLNKQINNALINRQLSLKKKRKDSVAINRKFLKK